MVWMIVIFKPAPTNLNYYFVLLSTPIILLKVWESGWVV